MGLNFKKIFSYDGDDDNLVGTEDEYYSMSEEEAIKEADKSGNKMILLEPRAYSESQQIADHLKNRNSVVVLMHDAPTKKITAEALPQIISYMKQQGYEFKNFYEIIK